MSSMTPARPINVSAACRKLLGNAGDLAAIPGVAAQLLRMLDDPNATANAVAHEIGMDQGLTATMLRLANSPFYRATREVRDVTEALVVIGFDGAKRVLLSRLARLSQGKATPVQQALWRHALATAVGAQTCARVLKGVTVGHAFAAGLLHDIGKAAIYQADPRGFEQIWQRLVEEGGSSRNLERAKYDTDHCEVGEALTFTWELPPFYSVVARYHSDPQTIPDDVSTKDKRLVAMVSLANSLAGWLGYGPNDRQPVEEFPMHPSIGMIDARPALILQMAEHIAADTAELESVLS